MKITKRVILFFVTGAGAGYVPGAPGTAGTLVAIPLSLGLNRLAGASLSLALLTLIAFVALATWLCGKGEEIFQAKDSSHIVIDEVAGMLVANFAAPAGVKTVVLAFILFRFFDIMKPFPAARAERIPGGAGVILDDLIAGFYSLIVVRLLLAAGWL